MLPPESSRPPSAAKELSLSRLRQAVGDAWTIAKRVQPVMSKMVTIAVFCGVVGLASWKPEIFLPPATTGRVCLALFLLAMLAWPIAVAYRLRTLLDEQQEKFSAFPEAERELIRRLRTVAGTGLHRIYDADFASPAERESLSFDKECREVREICSKLYHYKAIYAAGMELAMGFDALAVHTRTAALLQEAYNSLLRECDKVLTQPLPPP